MSAEGSVVPRGKRKWILLRSDYEVFCVNASRAWWVLGWSLGGVDFGGAEMQVQEFGLAVRGN